MARILAENPVPDLSLESAAALGQSTDRISRSFKGQRIETIDGSVAFY
jgi:hypothetical protein